ncbi:hypothetical protein VKT23_006050 [Stygiomarasmius scandens]|uniref:Short-chain dehydrogenase n=1 Tax=Marasmiellus scandens TaxID=2682957 RepID=A0ABR1JQH9_9AGAR
MTRYTVFRYLKEQRRGIPAVVKANLRGKTIVVVGANVGLGYEAAKHFASMNPGRLILACRNLQRGEEAISNLKLSTGFPHIELRILDLNSFSSIKHFVDKLDAEESRLDILVENAGIHANNKYETTKDGWSTILQTNCIAPALLAFCLLPQMIKTARQHSVTPRIVVTSSFMHHWSTLDKNSLILKSRNALKTMSSPEYFRKTSAQIQYCDSKLINLLFIRALQRKLSNELPIIINAVNPGYCVSNIRRNWTGIKALSNSFMEKIMAYTTEEGSRPIVHGAVGDLGHGFKSDSKQGGYINLDYKVVEPSDFVSSKEGIHLQDKIWDELLELLPSVGSNLEIIDQYLEHYL